MLAIYKRELRAYFTSPIGYVFLAIFLVFANLYFYMYGIMSQTSDLTGTFNNLLFICSFIIPILTMRLYSEDKKQKTEQLLLTSPVSITGIVVGKYLSCLTVFAIALLCTFTWPLIVTMYGTPFIYTIIGNYAALFFAVAGFIAIGLFLSSLTESQIVAAITSFAVYMGLYLTGAVASGIENNFMRFLMKFISLFARYQNFSLGLFALDDIVYYISITVIFLFLTGRVIEKKRWA